MPRNTKSSKIKFPEAENSAQKMKISSPNDPITETSGSYDVWLEAKNESYGGLLIFETNNLGGIANNPDIIEHESFSKGKIYDVTSIISKEVMNLCLRNSQLKARQITKEMNHNEIVEKEGAEYINGTNRQEVEIIPTNVIVRHNKLAESRPEVLKNDIQELTDPESEPTLKSSRKYSICLNNEKESEFLDDVSECTNTAFNSSLPKSDVELLDSNLPNRSKYLPSISEKTCKPEGNSGSVKSLNSVSPDSAIYTKRHAPTVVYDGNEIKITVDVSGFDTDQFEATLRGDTFTVHCNRTDTNQYGYETLELYQEFEIPQIVAKKMVIDLSAGNILTIVAPIKECYNQEMRK